MDFFNRVAIIPGAASMRGFGRATAELMANRRWKFGLSGLNYVFFFKQKTAYEILACLEFRRVLFRSADHILDWFHISMKFTNLGQIAKGINACADGGVRVHALAEIEHAKWRLWNGLTDRGIVGLIHLGQWAQARCFEHIPSLKKLALMLPETIRYLELNADSMPDY